MIDNEDPPDPSVIRLPTAQGHGEGLGAAMARSWEEEKREKIDEMFARVERGEISEEERVMLENDAACRALGLRRPSIDSLPPWIQPAVRKVLEMDVESWRKLGQGGSG